MFSREMTAENEGIIPFNDYMAGFGRTQEWTFCLLRKLERPLLMSR